VVTIPAASPTVRASPTPAESARRRIERLRAANPAAADLATLLSTAVRIEPLLVRRVRLLLAEADVGAELDLWSSEILASASPLAISFDPACAEELRSDLAGAAYDMLRDRIGDLIAASHAESHWSLRLEERINRLMVGGDPAAAQQAERLLYAAIGELRDQVSDPSADPVPIARWLLAALGRIPRAVAATEAGVVAKLSAGTQLDRRFDPPDGASAALEAWMPWLLATARVEMRTVPVRFPHGYLLVNQPGPGEVTLLVPGTDPMTLYVTWHDGTQAQHERLRFRAGEPLSLPIPVDEATLETLAGERWRLRRRTDGEGAGDLVGGLDFSAARARLRPCLDRVSQLDSVVDAVTRPSPSVVALTGPAGVGKSVLLGAALDRLEGAGYLIVQHFYGVQRTWDTPETVTASLRAKLEAALGPAMDTLAEPPTPPLSSEPVAESAARVPEPERRRRALIIANGQYQDPGLSQLRSAESDARALADVLRYRSASFDEENVRIVLNAPGSAMRAEVEEFFASDQTDELLLLYFSGHAIVGPQGELYLTATDTVPRNLGTTAMSVRSIRAAIIRSGSPNIVLILDCPTGDAAMGVKELTAAPTATGSSGQQVAVLSAPNAIHGLDEESSRFTGLLIAGLSGQADLDADGAISVQELYEYARRRWSEVGSGPRGPEPSLTASGNGGAIVLTRQAADEPVAARAREESAAPPPTLPAATLQAAAAAARQAGLRGIVIALDGLPGSSEAEVDQFLLQQAPISGFLPLGVSVLVSTRNGRGVRYQEAFGADAVVVQVDDSSTEQVCRLLLDWRRTELASAFADPAELDELIRFSGGVPGRLQGIIEWLGDQQVGSVRLADLPPTLSASADTMWDKLEAQGLHHDLGVIAVAGAGLTMADLTAIIRKSAEPPGSSPAVAVTLSTCARLTEALADLRLVRLDGPAEEPGTVVTVSHPSVTAAYADRFTTETTAAHGRHVTAFPYHDPSSAGPYQIASAAYHHVRYGEPGRVAQLASCGGYLDLRQRSAGVDALAADLAELAALAAGSPQVNEAELVGRAVGTSASAARAEPDRFVDLVANGLRALGAADLAETVFADWWHPPLRLREVFRVEPAEPIWRKEERVTAATRWSPGQIVSASADGSIRLYTGATIGWTQSGPDLPVFMIRWGDRLAVTSGTALFLTTPGSPPSPPEHVATVGAEVTASLAEGGFLFAGLRDGTVLVFSLGTGGGVERRTLVGHSAAVTALAKSGTSLLSASDDGTVRVWDPLKDNPLHIYRGHGTAVVALALLDSGAVVSGDDRGRLRWWSPETGADVGVLGRHRARVTAILARPGAIAVTADLDGALWRWNLAEPGRPVDLSLRPPGPALLKLAVTGTGSVDTVVGWTADGVLTWWDPADGTVLQTIRPDGVAEPVHDLFADESTVVLAHAAGLVAYLAPRRPDPAGATRPAEPSRRPGSHRQSLA
jgi:WD40 repeat protein